ncbi:MAG: FAD-dependent oxidoreductase, partial [Proteobacteria bacterium]|nr:FAD-dependent oxidoreductase [Pseudomonadota bacterium]
APELRALDRITFAAWLDARKLTSERLRWLCDYACRDDYALTAASASAWAGLFYFASRQRTAAGADAAEAQTVLTWPDGNGALVRHLADGLTIERDVAVRSIREVDGLVEVAAVGPGGAAVGLRCDHVIVATPSFVARRIVGDAPALAPTGDHGAWAVANVHLRGRPRERKGVAPAWDNVFRDSASLGYVSATHQRGRDRGATVWTWYYAFADEDAVAVRRKLAGAGYAEWAETVLTDLERAHPDVRAQVDHLEVAFWGHGMIRPRPNTMFDPARIASRSPRGRVHFAHTDLSAIALFEEAFHHGLRAADEVVAGLA